tara:strand:- start:33931 stop:34845 length:915 start_codon:yes stop_codon:yes gene_type:complete
MNKNVPAEIKTKLLHPNVIELDLGSLKSGDCRWVLLTSDRHWDNPKSDWAMQKKHLQQAKERNAKVLDFGDFFCAMQGKYDPRKRKSEVREEHNVDGYLDALVYTATDFFKPYAKSFACIALGNHESMILKRLESNIVDRLVSHLNKEADTKIHSTGFHGWIVFKARNGNKALSQLRLKYHHGYGGGGPVTKGVIQTNRRAVYLPDADIVCVGHIHESWFLELPRERITTKGIPYIDTQTHIQLPTYKQEYTLGKDLGTFHIEKGRPPKPIGATWLKFYVGGECLGEDTKKQSTYLKYSVERAD